MRILAVSLCLLVTGAVADVSHVVAQNRGAQARSPEADAQTLVSEQEVDHDGTFHYKYETSNGISAEEQGDLQNVGAEQPALHVTGKAHWTARDGEDVGFSYEAGVKGYVAYGPSIPQPPPIPPYIQRALDWIAAHPPKPDPQE